ncbi:dialkylresorcinol condensing enzyme [Uliginosibacterium sp. H3]|uniref:Dialkylresorcinol condensing enzyme n=1 Tax=Uliginosibacterium silvisoli TaxID=3114758 RepID=A0ABU6K2T9_9RHOO|nr:dialkylresorcinol condensing enzyme [Uliginosibacterium sp. H3]
MSSPNAAKRVLVINYSQSGQLSRIVERIIAPLKDAPGISVHVETLHPSKPFAFPWSMRGFLDAFPESALQLPGTLKPLSLSGEEDFDLVILPYQVWFLAPSQPVVAFMRHPVAHKLLRGKPVVTVIACRNMWMLAQEKMKLLIATAGGRLIDNVALTDNASTLATLVTTPLWVLTGNRQVLKSLPPAGVSEHDILHTTRFGKALRDALHEGSEKQSAPLLSGLCAAKVNPNLFVSEKAATRSFFIWGHILHAAGPAGSARRVPLLAIYSLFLVAMVFTVVPLSLVLQAILRPLLASRLARMKQSFEQPSGSDSTRMSRYDL